MPVGRSYPSASAALYTSLLLTFALVLALALVALIAIPETVLELARIACMESLSLVDPSQ